MKIPILFFSVAFALILQGCWVYPSLTHDYTPYPKVFDQPLTNKIVVMKPLDMRGHAGTTPIYQAYIPFVPYIRTIEEPEQFIYAADGFKFDYENDFAKLVAIDLQSSGIADDVVASPDMVAIPPLVTGTAQPDYIIKLSIQQLDWQTKYSMFCLSVIGYVPQIIGFPNSYGFSYLKFSAEIYDSKGTAIASKSFSATESQNGWIYYDSGYLRALTEAYKQTSPDFRQFVASSIKKSSHQADQ